MQIDFPQGLAGWAGKGPANSLILLVAGGRAPESRWLSSMASRYSIWAVDRGLEACQKAGIKPALVVGDADSATAAAWKWADDENLTILRYPRDKDRTDLQLALTELAVRQPGAAVLLTGGWGGRFDHAFSNVFSLLEVSAEPLHLCGLADADEMMLFVDGGQHLTVSFSQKPRAISLLPLAETCTGISLNGVHWPLTESVLRLDSPAAISNRLAQDSSQVEVSLRRGRIGFYCCWAETNL